MAQAQFIHDGDAIDYTPGADVAAGDVVVLSDLFSGGPEPDSESSTPENNASGAEDLIDAIGHLRHRKHELIVIQVLDRAELEFPFQDAGQIQDIETDRIITADAEAIRTHYLQRVSAYNDAIRRGCLRREAGYVLADTSDPFEAFLGQYLARRQQGLL